MAKKRGFTVPVGEWISAARRATRSFGGGATRDLRDLPRRQRREALHRRGRETRAGFAAWTLLFYALWHRHHIQRLPASTDVFATLAG